MNKVVTDLDFMMTQGDKKVIEVSLFDEEGDAADLTGLTATWVVKLSEGADPSLTIPNGSITITAGKVSWTLLNSHTASFLGNYIHILTLYDGTEPITVLHVDGNGDERPYGKIVFNARP